MSVTPLVRILIIFHFLRQALGTQTAPTNQTLIGLGLLLFGAEKLPKLARSAGAAKKEFMVGQAEADAAAAKAREDARVFPSAALQASELDGQDYRFD